MQRAPVTEPHLNRVLLFLPSGTGKGGPVEKRPAHPAVSRLPLEILGEIFLIATASNGSPRDEDPVETLLNATLVCKAWWHAALATHQLWATLHLCLDPRKVSDDLYDGVSNWFERAGSLPRSLELYSFGDTGNKDLDETIEIFGEREDLPPIVATILTACRPSLTSLSLINFTPKSVGYILSTLKGTAAYSRRFLERLRIDLRVSSPVRPWDSGLDVFHNLPPVQHLDLRLNQASIQDTDSTIDEDEDDWEDDSNPLIIGPSLLKGLKTLRMAGDWDVQDVIGTLKGCSNLQDLILDHIRDGLEFQRPGTDDLDIPAVSLPKLKTLRLQRLHWTDNNGMFLSVVKAPELEHIHIEFCAGEGRAHNVAAKSRSSTMEISDSEDGTEDGMDVDAESCSTSFSKGVEDHLGALNSLCTFLQPCLSTLRTVEILNCGRRLNSCSLATIMAYLGPHTRLQLDERVIPNLLCRVPEKV
ncbi:hypothetical protein FA13DRAFT_1731350 [Coprinellus micaceus]|uniref:F-box domain-containing protein n=1 Tax=Coprinellus micaceus TaxID=71717 RepID=A0A4Y7TF75_COPMI|nr:hypothetical protein FA13DRAFT_1731350 [Coprinellus micaceus]